MEEYFIGIEIPPPHKEKIMALRKNAVKKNLIKIKERYFPHITIYAQGFDREKELLNLFNFNFKKFTISLVGIDVFRKKILKDILHITLEKSEGLQKVQGKIVNLLSPIRNNEFPKIISESREPLTDREIQLIENHGYPYLKDEYRPHMTIGTFKEEKKLKKTIEIFNDLKFPLEFTVNKISLFKKINGFWKEIKSVNAET